MKTISIKTTQELEQTLNEAINDIDYLRDAVVEISPEFLNVRIKLTGKRFDSSITTSAMEGILEFQEVVYRIAKEAKGPGSRLTHEEKKRLELVVKFEKGSIDVNFDLGEALKNMTGEQIVITAGILAVAWVVVKLGTVIVEKIAETKKAAIKERKSLATVEKDKQLYQVFENIITHTIDAKNEFSKKISEASPKTLTLGETPVDLSILSEMLTIPRKKIVPVKSVESGSYRIVALYFDRNAGTVADMIEVTSGEHLNGVNLQDGFISESDFSIIKEAESKNPVGLELIVERREGEYKTAFLNKVLKSDDTSGSRIELN